MSESKEQQPRYGFVVFTGRHKILDYHKPDGQQIATADNEDAARTIVRALNAHASDAALVEALRRSRDWMKAPMGGGLLHERFGDDKTCEADCLRCAVNAALELAHKES